VAIAPKAPPKRAAEKVTAPKVKTPAKADREKVAANKLSLAKSLLQSNEDAARKRLEEIVKDFQGTAAAQEAEKLLKAKQ
jgi:hypothetical protein